MEDKALDRAAEAIATTPLDGCMDDNGDAVYIRHIWPVDGKRLRATLKNMARAAVGAYHRNRR